MATIKSFTDLQQSKKLAEILPLESADWTILNCVNEFGKKDGSNIRVVKEVHTLNDSVEKIPCWSLAALLELLPKRLEIVDNVYELSVYLYGLYYWNVINGNLCFESKDNDNLVDACYDMILKLHELKML